MDIGKYTPRNAVRLESDKMGDIKTPSPEFRIACESLLTGDDFRSSSELFHAISV